jgi:hypothetical protein
MIRPMSTVACIRVMVEEPVACPPGMTLAGLVEKIAGAFLESTWIWPRRFGVVAPFAFALTDPRAVQLDARELQALARDLQLKLFGDQGYGGVQLLLLEGDQTEVMRFARARPEDLTSVLEEGEAGAFTGRLCRISPTEAVAIHPPDATVVGDPTLEALAAMPAPAQSDDADVIEAFRRAVHATGVFPGRFEWIGLYVFDRERFIGARVVPQGGRFDDQSGAAALQRDLAGLEFVSASARQGGKGYLLANLDFTALVRRSGRNALAARLATAPMEERRRLGVTIRNVPREPSFAAMQQLAELLRPNYAMLELRVSDPDFRIEALPPCGVTMVSLGLETLEDRGRLLAIKRFAEHRAAYRKKKVWQAVVGLKSAAEVELCHALKLQIGSGPAVSARSDRPLEPCSWSRADLPRRASPDPAHEKGDPVARAASSVSQDARV